MRGSRLHTSIVAPRHEYTRSKAPWILDESKSAYGKLIHYISGGGMCAFGRTIHQEERAIRQRKAWIWLGVIFAFWLVFYFI